MPRAFTAFCLVAFLAFMGRAQAQAPTQAQPPTRAQSDRTAAVCADLDRMVQASQQGFRPLIQGAARRGENDTRRYRSNARLFGGATCEVVDAGSVRTMSCRLPAAQGEAEYVGLRDALLGCFARTPAIQFAEYCVRRDAHGPADRDQSLHFQARDAGAAQFTGQLDYDPSVPRGRPGRVTITLGTVVDAVPTLADRFDATRMCRHNIRR